MNTYDYNISDIVNKYSRHVAMLSYTYTKNIADAEDIAQDVFLQLVKSNKKFENEEHLRAWLFRIAINKSKNHLKSFWISHRSDFPTENTSIHEKDYDLIRSVLELELTTTEFAIAMLAARGWTTQEIAKHLNISANTVKDHISEAMKKLHTIF